MKTRGVVRQREDNTRRQYKAAGQGRAGQGRAWQDRIEERLDRAQQCRVGYGNK